MKRWLRLAKRAAAYAQIEPFANVGIPLHEAGMFMRWQGDAGKSPKQVDGIFAALGLFALLMAFITGEWRPGAEVER